LALAEDKAGNSMAAKMAITAITTSNSTKVNASDRERFCDLMAKRITSTTMTGHPHR
jgi:hypothetical protein